MTNGEISSLMMKMKAIEFYEPRLDTIWWNFQLDDSADGEARNGQASRRYSTNLRNRSDAMDSV